MLPAKLVFFFNFAQVGCVYEYMLLFYVSVGLTSSKAGLVMGIGFIGAMIGGPFWGFIADKKLCHRVVTKILCIVSIFLMCSLPVISHVFGNKGVISCQPKMKFNRSLTNITAKMGIQRQDNTRLFQILLLVVPITAFFNGPTTVFVQSGLLKTIQASGQHIDIGKQSVLGPIGFAVAGFVSGIVMDNFSIPNVSCYSGMFIVYTVMTICLVVCFHFVFTDEVVNHTAKTKNEENVPKDLSRTLKHFGTWLYFLITLFNGISQGLVLSFSFLYLNEMNASKSLMGLSTLVNGLSSLITFCLSKHIIKFCRGPIGAMGLNFFCRFIRCLCLHYMNNPYLILPINVINGLTSALFVVSSLEYVKIKFSPSINTVMCGITVMLNNHLGGMLSLIVGGKMYMMYGGKQLFLSCSIACSVFCVITVGYAVLNRQRKRYKGGDDDDDDNAAYRLTSSE